MTLPQVFTRQKVGPRRRVTYQADRVTLTLGWPDLSCKPNWKKNWVTLQRRCPSNRGTLSPCKQVLRINFSGAMPQNRKHLERLSVIFMMCSTGFLKVNHKLLWCVALGFLKHPVSFSSFVFFKALSSVSFRDRGLEITNKHQPPSFEKCTNYKENKFSWRNCKT